jgi:micrococcal nuclease
MPTAAGDAWSHVARGRECGVAEIIRYRRLKHEPPKPLQTLERQQRRRGRLITLALMCLAFAVAATAGSLALPHVLPQAQPRTALMGLTGITADLPLCRGQSGGSCVIDGDTFRLEGQSIRIADIDAPESRGSKCPTEKALADRATERIQQLLNAGPFVLDPADRDEDRYGRKLRIVTRDGESLGDILIAEGLARRWDGARRPWC